VKERKRKLTSYDPGEFRRQFSVLLWVVLCVFFFLSFKMWYLQIIQGDELRQRSHNNRIRLQEIAPLRGLILDTDGDILVDNQASFDISIIPETAKDVKSVIRKLSDEYKLGREPLADGNSSRRYTAKPFVPRKLFRNIGREKLAVVETNSLDLSGVVVDVVPVRKYVMGEMMAHVLGYVGEISLNELKHERNDIYRPGDIVGKLGIERCVDQYLKGERGGQQIEVNVSGRKLDVLGQVPAIPGNTVELTIDRDLQKACWDAFQEKAGSVIVMDVRDGSIRAMVNKPSFDPNLFNRGISGDDWNSLVGNPLSPLQNRAISGQYPPGSTFKIIVAAAALEEGVITGDTTFYCNGTYDALSRPFRCWEEDGHGRIDLYRAIVESCDVYFYNVGSQVGVDKLAEYARGFGFGTKTGIDLPSEEDGLVPTREWKLRKFGEPWQIGETVTLSIGQGFILVTPLQLLRAYCAVANGGTLYRPRLIKSIRTEDGDIVDEYKPQEQGRLPVSPETIKRLQRALWGAVNDNRGTGAALKRKTRDVCGKTGTAQVIEQPREEDPVKDQVDVPYQHRDHALFVCYAPYEHPEVAVMVVVDHGGHGGSVAAPIARKVIDRYFDMKRIKDSTGKEPKVQASAGKTGRL
jgi:penicillin-binding protein 2